MAGKYWMQTKRCIKCLKKATVHGGHVTSKEYKTIIAGWCEEHSDTPSPDLLNRVGCFGHFDERYGIEPYWANLTTE